jgi:hypothetical protein
MTTLQILGIIVGSIGILITVVSAIKGAAESKGDKLTIISFVSIPLFAITAAVAILMPQDPGYSFREIAMLVLVVVLGIIVAETNRRSVGKDLAKVKRMKKK